MASKSKSAASAMEIDRLATQLAMDPHSKAFLPLAEEYCKVGMWEEAVSVLEEGLKHYPGFITAMVVLGRAYDQINQPTKARAVLEGAVQLSPENLRAHRTLIKIYTSQGLKEAALQSCNVILAMNPKDEEALSVLASLGVPPKQELAQPIQAAPLQSKTSAPKPETEPQLPATHSTESEQDLSEESTTIEESVATIEETASPDSPITLASSIMETALQENDQSPVGKQTAADPQPIPSDPSSIPSPHAATIAQLESWLRSIERQRRDRAAFENHNS